MASSLNLYLDCGYYKGIVGGLSFEFPVNRDNKYALILFLRGFKDASGKQGLFSQQQIADALPGFEGRTRQSIDDHERRFRESDNNLRLYLARKGKVDEAVVAGVRDGLLKSPFSSDSELAKYVNECLGRDDISAANVKSALEQIPFSDVRGLLREQLAAGQAHYKESFLLEEMMATYSSEAGEKAALSDSESSGMTLSHLTVIEKLLRPDVPIADTSLSLFWIAFAIRLFFFGVTTW